MFQTLALPRGCQGAVWRYVFRGVVLRVHRHRELEVNLALRGRARYLVDGRRYDMRPDMLIWLFPEQEHVLLDQSPDYEMWVLVFTPELLRRACVTAASKSLLAARPRGDFCRPVVGAQAAGLASLFHELHDAQQTDPARCNAGLAYAALTAWSVFSAAEQIPFPRQVHPAVEKAARLIRDDHGSAASIEQLAERCALSVSRLSRLFKQQAGVSLVNYRQRQRLEKFLRLYDRGQRISMTAAALEAGFGSYAQFHRVFTMMMGCSPRRYRKERGRIAV